MLVFRDAPGVPAQPDAFCSHARGSAEAIATAGNVGHDAAVSLLIDVGMLEAACADALAGGAHQGLRAALRAASVAAGHVVAASWSEELPRARTSAAACAAALSRARPQLPSDTLWLRTPEGYAYYGLYPETYIEAARQVRERHQPRRALCVGIRSIGTGLSAVVVAELERHGCAVSSFTVRPRGHPFAREVDLADEGVSRITDGPDLALVVDEGPGLSASSFAATVQALTRAGVPPDRIMILPAHDPDPSGLVSAYAADAWRQRPRILQSFESVWMDSGRLARAIGMTPVDDLSAGRWRARFSAGEVALQPQHERRKYIARTPDGRAYLVKFAGLGRFGHDLARRGERLRSTAASYEEQLACGFLTRPLIDGEPVSVHSVDAEFVETAAGYLCDVAERFSTGQAADPEPLARMLEQNTRELFGEPPRRLSRVLRQAAAAGPRPAIDLDARMLPHEWLRRHETGAAHYVKVDALEHHDDHFYPGPQDIAWDAAATIAEFEFDPAARERFLAILERRLGSISDRIEFFNAAYLAFRAAYCAMGAEALSAGGGDDARRLAAAGTRYRARLAAALGHRLAPS